MKKILVVFLLLISGSVSAHGYYYGYRNNWVAPFVVGAGVGYLVTRPYYPTYVYTPPPPVVIQQPFPSTEYHQENILDANCNCYRLVWVHN